MYSRRFRNLSNYYAIRRARRFVFRGRLRRANVLSARERALRRRVSVRRFAQGLQRFECPR